MTQSHRQYVNVYSRVIPTNEPSFESGDADADESVDAHGLDEDGEGGEDEEEGRFVEALQPPWTHTSDAVATMVHSRHLCPLLTTTANRPTTVMYW